MKLRLLFSTSVMVLSVLCCNVMMLAKTGGNCGGVSCYDPCVKWELDDNGVLTLTGDWSPSNNYGGKMGYFNSKIAVPWNKSAIVKIVVKNGVSGIGAEAFMDCVNLKEVVFQQTDNPPLEFSQAVFKGCTSLESFSFPDYVVKMGFNTFEGCTSLKTVKLSTGDKYIRQGFFKDCKKLGPEIILPDGILFIGNSAFENCTALNTVVINDNCETVAVHAFRWCVNLNKITIGKSVKEFGEAAFYSAGSGIERHVIIRDMATYCQANFATSNVSGYWQASSPICYNNTNLYIGDINHPVTHLDIPEGVTEIKTEHFIYLCNLNSITIPTTMRSLGGRTFRCGNNVWDFIECWAATPPDVEDSGFVSISSYNNTKLYVPKGSLSKYKSHKIWGQFKSIEEKDITEGVEIIDKEDPIKVYVDGGQIIVDGADEDTTMQVYSLDGKCVYGGALAAVNAPSAGVYIVRVAGKAIKVMVK